MSYHDQLIGTETDRNTTHEQQFRSLFQDPTFINGYIERQTRLEQHAVDEIQKKTAVSAERRFKNALENEARINLGLTSIEEGHKMGKAWGAALKEAEKMMPGDLHTDLKHQSMEHARAEFSAEYEAARTILLVAQEEYRLSLNAIRDAFDVALEHPTFKKILDMWRDAPSLDGSIKHSGLVHFIEYRSEKSKDRLEKVPEGFSPEGFAAYTRRLMAYAQNPRDESVHEALCLEDENSRQRLLIATKDLQFISFFRDSADEPWRLIPHIPDFAPKQWEKTKSNMRSTEDQAKYFNRLGNGIREIIL